LKAQETWYSVKWVQTKTNESKDTIIKVDQEQEDRYNRYMKAISQMMGRSEPGAVETSRIRY
jgi:hypothetical protein